MLVKQNYDIPGASKRIDKLIQNCVTCILATKKKGKKDGWLYTIDKHDDVPLHAYSLDHVGLLETTQKQWWWMDLQNLHGCNKCNKKRLR